MSNLDKEYNFYFDNKGKLIEKYLDKWIVIKGNKIIGYYNNLNDAIELTSLNHKFGTFMVRQVLEKELEIIW